jgi:hypothetical protein
MANDFKYDVFLSHSSKDKVVVRGIADRLRTDGLQVWLDDWEIKPGYNIPAKIEEGLEQSRVLVLCISKNAFGSDWAMLESQTFRFRDPLNQDRRFIPVRLDRAPIKGSLAQFFYISWLPASREQAYAKLLDACLAKQSASELEVAVERVGEKAIKSDFKPGRVLHFPKAIRNADKLPKPSAKAVKRSVDRTIYEGARAAATRGSVSVAIAGSNQGDINIKMPIPKSSGIKYPANSIGADANLTNYIEYLCSLYAEFVTPIEPDKNKSWAKLGKQIKTKFRLIKRTRNHLSAERFPDLVDYLVNEKLAHTPVGRKHLRQGKRFCRTFEEFRHGEM